MPKISVIIPTYNRKNYLLQALDSVLGQVDSDFEIIVSDNCSTDGTAEVIKAYLHDPRVRYFRNESNVGMVGNWRKALYDRARCEWFVLMSDDDYFTDNAYLTTVAALIDSADVRLVYAGGHVQDITRGTTTLMLPQYSGVVDGRTVFASRGKIAPQDFLLCNVFFRRDDALRLGFLSNDYNLSSDSEFFLKVALEGNVGIVREPVCVYRVHSGNLTKTVFRSARLVRGNLEHLVLPYAHGVSVKVDPDVLSTFRANSELDKVVRGTLLRLGGYDSEMLEECRRFLMERAPEVLKKVESDPLYLLARLLFRCSPRLFRLRFQMGP